MNESSAVTDKEQLKGKIQRTTVRYLARLVRSTQIPGLLLAVAVVLSILSAVAGLVVPLITGNLIDEFSIESLKVGMILILAGIFVLEAISGGISYYMLAYVGHRTVNRIRKRLWRQTLNLPVSFFDRHRSADTMSRIANDTNEIKTLITDHLISFCSNILTVVGAVAILFVLDWQMTLIILLAVPLGMAVLMPIGGKMYKISLGMQEQLAKLAALLTQVVSEIRLVKASNSEKREQRSGEERMDDLYHYGMKEARIHAVLGPLMSMVMVVLLVVIIGYGGVRVSTGALSAGELVAFILLLFQIMFPFSQFATFYSQVQKVMGATERLKLILDTAEEVPGPLTAKLGEQQDLQMREVSFAYKNEESVLRSVSFTIPARQVTALVGPSGSGKTTIFSLLERFYEPESGDIDFGGESIRQFSLTSWRRKIGYVSQESSLMVGTIRENIIYGREDEVSEEELLEAARLAYAHEFIERLPQGYDTEVGERGIQLSGGQRQRVAIARALLRRPDILLLDEATASLDSDSEHEVQRALHNLMRNRTTIVIAHRLATVVEADQIIVLEHGAVTGQGTHTDLMDSHQVYAEWARKQFRGRESHDNPREFE